MKNKRGQRSVRNNKVHAYASRANAFRALRRLKAKKRGDDLGQFVHADGLSHDD